MAFVKMLWASGSPIPLLGSWDYWTSVSKIIISDETLPNANWVTKKNNKIAYYGVFHSQNASPTTYGYIVISPDSSGAASSYRGSTVYNSGTIVDVNNITWYYTYRVNGLTFSSAPDYCLNAREEDGINQIAQNLLDRIYAVPFHEDYQNTYYILNKTDVRRTLRKVYGLTLAFIGTGYVYPNVQYISDNADSIINDILTKIGNNTDVHIWMYSKYDNPSRGIYINVYYGTNSDVNAWVDVPKESFYGLEYYSIGTVSTLSDLYSIYVNNGTPTVTESSGAFSIPIMGIAARGLYDLVITNYGADY